VFSPDGRFIAYDLSMTDTRSVSHIFVMATDASSETAIVTDKSVNIVMGWAADGHLLFASDRSGSLDLWALGVADGRARQAATLVKSGIASAWSLGLSASNTLYIWQRASPMSVQVAGIDAKTGAADVSQPEFRQFVDSRGRPSWSDDGKQLLFISCGASGGGPCRLLVRNNDTGAIRDVPHRLGYLGFPRFSPDGASVVTDGTDLKGRSGIYLINLADGETRMLTLRDTALRQRNPQWSRDGKGIFWMLQRNGAIVLARHELATGDEKEVFRTSSSGVQNFRVSPDETQVAYLRADNAAAQSLLVSPIEGGPARALFSAAQPEGFSFQWHWRSDGRAIYISKLDWTRGVGGLWTVPLDGAPRRVDVDTSKWVDGNLFSIDPSDRKVAYVTFAGNAGAEVWALEHVLPTAHSTGSRRR
jgi:Tol biopolymer transport system component